MEVFAVNGSRSQARRGLLSVTRGERYNVQPSAHIERAVEPLVERGSGADWKV